MKKILLCSALVLGISGISFAQENVSIGPIVGVSVANLRGDIANNDWKAGLTIGGFYNYSSRTGLGFSGQVLYTQLGAQVLDKTNDIRLNYLQVPLLLTYFLGEYGNPIRPKLFIGPHVNFLLNAKDRNGNDLYGESNNRNYNPVDVGLTAGVGLNYRIKNKVWLNTDIRYGLGLVDITKSNSTSIMNHNIGVNLGISFPFGTYNKNTGTLRAR
ncbi:porin family protein [Salmonirosea aquatica]|uniref:Outer membrane beta-barrel protein n=1 Tax=Salmonirosea aquatica TaxID=2654236 RepID=A0A7C9G037_9BACT|nr:outer membrane beta-barrel protein [Cytophagaceae bacterium SJW1-29]